ncbi:MAG: hypothetical protein F6K10_18330 [Moorea sp. SIO2B7]|nr:hypothetical protein [Moorena sp. SIO2B7]
MSGERSDLAKRELAEASALVRDHASVKHKQYMGFTRTDAKALERECVIEVVDDLIIN